MDGRCWAGSMMMAEGKPDGVKRFPLLWCESAAWDGGGTVFNVRDQVSRPHLCEVFESRDADALCDAIQYAIQFGN
jgi:hypothetical protein